MSLSVSYSPCSSKAHTAAPLQCLVVNCILRPNDCCSSIKGNIFRVFGSHDTFPERENCVRLYIKTQCFDSLLATRIIALHLLTFSEIRTLYRRINTESYQYDCLWYLRSKLWGSRPLVSEMIKCDFRHRNQADIKINTFINPQIYVKLKWKFIRTYYQCLLQLILSLSNLFTLFFRIIFNQWKFCDNVLKGIEQ